MLVFFSLSSFSLVSDFGRFSVYSCNTYMVCVLMRIRLYACISEASICVKVESWSREVRLLLYDARFTTHIYKFPENRLAGCTELCVKFCLSFLPLSSNSCVCVCLRMYTNSTLNNVHCTVHACMLTCICVWCFSSFVGLLCIFLPLCRASSYIQPVQSSTNMHICSVRVYLNSTYIFSHLLYWTL